MKIARKFWQINTHATNRERHAHDYINRKFILATLKPQVPRLPHAQTTLHIALVMDGKWHYCFSLICLLFAKEKVIHRACPNGLYYSYYSS